MIHGLGVGAFDPKLTFAIGSVVTSWSVFDGFFDKWLSLLHRPATIGAAYPPVPDRFAKRAGRMRDILCSVSNLPDKDAKEIAKLAKRTMDIGERRNIVCHGHWLSGAPILVFYERRGVLTKYTVTLDDLERLSSDIHGLFVQYSGIFLLSSQNQEAHNWATWLTSPGKDALQTFLDDARQSPPIQQELKPLQKSFPR